MVMRINGDVLIACKAEETGCQIELTVDIAYGVTCLRETGNDRDCRQNSAQWSVGERIAYVQDWKRPELTGVPCGEGNRAYV